MIYSHKRVISFWTEIIIVHKFKNSDLGISEYEGDLHLILHYFSLVFQYKCEDKNCYVTNNRSLLPSVDMFDVVLFHQR